VRKYNRSYPSGTLTALLILVACFSFVAGPLTAHALPAYQGEYVVTLKPQTVASGAVGILSAPELDEQVTVLQRMDGSAVITDNGTAWQAARVSNSSVLEALVTPDDDLCKRLLASKSVESCTPNYLLSVSELSSGDPLMSYLWGMTDEQGVGAVTTWGSPDGAGDVVAAVIDTGVDYTHEDLAANTWRNPGEVSGNGIDDDGNGYVDDVHGVNLVPGAANVGDPMDDNQHGTHVAGTIGAVHDNGAGVRGVSRSVKLLPIKFMDSSGSGRLSDAIAAIDYMVDLKVNRGVNIRVANNSWGGGGYSPALEAAIRRASNAGIVFVVASGNSATDVDLFPAYPGSYDVENIVSVAAIDQQQNLASFSNYGSVGVDIAAPGVDITSTLPGQRYGALSGTSMAAPHVAGSLATLFSVSPSVSVTEAIARLLETGKPLESLASPDGTLSYVRSRRGVSAARLLADSRMPINDPDNSLPPCGYQFQVANVVETGALDDGADKLNPINQVDEGDFKTIALPFEFPFFRTKTRTLYVSPNGVVYLNPPRSADYQVASRAPNNSIAAFHSDLTPRNSKQGVRAYVGSDRVVIYWLSEHYSIPEQGPLAVRLTLYPSGLIRSTVSFEAAKDPTALSRMILGDWQSSQPKAPLGLIGASATSAAMSSTVDIVTAQRGLAPSAGSRLDLSVAMVPTCFEPSTNGPPEEELQIARVDSIRMRLSSNQRQVAVQLSGAGSGKVPLRATINGRWCSQVAWSAISNGQGAFKLSLPRTAYRVALHSTEAKKTLQVRRPQSARRGEKLSNMCAQLLQSVR
jgi:subtilisin family serine protease